MPRCRALLAVLLALVWCSAIMHGGLEAVGLMLDHAHHAHDDADHAPHQPAGAVDDHEQVFARDVAKDQIRVGAAGVLWFALPGLATRLTTAWRPRVLAHRATGPPLARVWHLVQRCAPESAAPPALG